MICKPRGREELNLKVGNMTDTNAGKGLKLSCSSFLS